MHLKLILVGLFVFAQVSQSFSQTGVSTYNHALSLYKQAKKQSLKHEYWNDSSARLFRHAAREYLNAGKKLASLNNKSLYMAALSLNHSAQLFDSANSIVEAYSAIRQFHDLWTTLNDIDKEAISKDTRVYENGRGFTVNAVATDEEWQRTFFEGRSNEAWLAYKKGEEDEAFGCAKLVIEKGAGYQDLVWQCSYVLMRIYAIKGRRCEASHYAANALAAALSLQVDSGYVFAWNNRIGYICDFLKNDSTECIPAKDLENAAIFLSGGRGPLKARPEDALVLGDIAYERGRKSKDLGFAMLNASVALNDEKEIKKWQHRLEWRQGSFDAKEWGKIQDSYEALQDSEKVEFARIQSARKFLKENSFFLIGTNPFNYLNREFVISVDYFRAFVSHEWRLDIMTDSRKPLATNENTLVFMYYKGFQASYTLKFNSLPQNGKYVYWGPQLRYTYRRLRDNYCDLEPIVLFIPPTRQIVHANSSEIAATFMLGKIYRFKHFFMDTYAGMGGGYKWLKTDVDLTKNIIHDEILDEKRWNHAYLVLRLGIRVGLLIKK